MLTRSDATTTERWFIGLALLWLLVGPRIELPGLSPLRVEDLVLGALALLSLRHLPSFLPQRLIGLAMLGIAVTGIVSGIAAAARGTLGLPTAVLYAVRPVEYVVALPAALLLLRGVDPRWRSRMDGLLAVTTVLQTLFAVLQYYFGLHVGFSHAAYTRAAGLTVGPYELGAISAALAVYWVARGKWVLVSLSAVALASSISRISLLGAVLGVAVLCACWVVAQIRRIRRSGWRGAFAPYLASKPRMVVDIVALGAAAAVLAFTLGLIKLPEQAAPPVAAPVQTAPPDDASPTPTPTGSAADSGGTADLPSAPSESVATRLADTSILGSWNVAGVLAAAVSPPPTATGYQDIAYGHLNEHVNADNAAQLGAEPSNLVRFFRWHLILDTMRSPIDVVLGLGPSFVGPSVDGSYLRWYADGGLLGIAAWLALIVVWFRRSPLWMTCVTLSMLVGGVFIDILYSERPLVLFWALLAISIVGRERAAAARPARPAVLREDAPAEAPKTLVGARA